MTLLIIYILLALGVSFLCSMMEASLLSVTPTYVKALEQEGRNVAGRLRQMKDDIDRPLASILSLNTIAHTVGAAGAGAQAAKVFGDTFVGIITATLTFLILVVSEIIPKTIGAVYWRHLIPAVVRILVPLMWLMWPLTKLSQALTRMLAKGKTTPAASRRQEFAAIADLGEEEGVFKEEESRILRNLFRFKYVRVKDVMTPRIVVFALSEDMTVEELIDQFDELRFSRIPVYRQNRDDITHYVLKDEILLHGAKEDKEVPLKEFEREIVVVPEMMPLPQLFERLLDTREHIALAVDEYGGTAGIVTMEDVMETLIGTEIVDEADSVKDMQALARQRWLERAKRLDIISKDFDEKMDADPELRKKIGINNSDKEKK
ncbi:HlyC/CorC family transporter [bacterium]|nr:HlyC/CorC family transporter [bacterium]